MLAVFLLALLPASAAADTTARIIVKRDAGLSAAERADIRADADVRFVETLPLPRTEVVVAAPGDVTDALRDLNADPDVEYAERDRPISAAADPETDPLWGLQRIQALAAWGLDTGAGETVAVVDSGVDASHPDLAGRIAGGGHDWVDDDNDPDDLNGHGTHVAGTIAATRDNTGVAGVAYGASILPLRVLNAAGNGYVSDAISAYDYAGDNGIRIVNASLGGVGALSFEYEAIERNPDVLFVVAAGNGDADGIGDDNDSSPDANYPCAYDLPNILCVGATDANDEPASFSNYGERSVDVFAPGVGIKSTAPGGGYGFKSGTSMATPHVAGTAALLLGQTSALTPEAVVEAVVNSADTSPELSGLSVSGGRLNAYDALASNDADGDGYADGADTCPMTPNPLQTADDDGDGTANACDATPRGADADGDGIGALDDACPGTYGTSASGCPVPPPPAPPTPPTTDDADGDGVTGASDNCPAESAATRDGCPLAQVASVSAKGSKRGSKRSATVTVVTTRLATVRITVERKRGGKWVRVARKTLVTSGNRARVRVTGLKRGSHRVRISVSSSSGTGTPVTKAFRVR